jgi:DNA-binding transcriptional regulator of glucitol operon
MDAFTQAIIIVVIVVIIIEIFKWYNWMNFKKTSLNFCLLLLIISWLLLTVFIITY